MHGSYRESSSSDADQLYDLCTKDGAVSTKNRVDREHLKVTIDFSDIHGKFQPLQEGGEVIPLEFNLKSSITQLGIDATEINIALNRAACSAKLEATLVAFGPLGVLALDEIKEGSFIGKLFAMDERRKIFTMDYVKRLEDSRDLKGQQLLSFDSSSLDLKLIGGRVVAMIPLLPGTITYGTAVHGLLPTIGTALATGTNYKALLKLHQKHDTDRSRLVVEGATLMVRSVFLGLRTMFGRVVQELLPEGVICTRSNIIEPDEKSAEFGAGAGAGRTFTFHGVTSSKELTHIPVEFYSLEAWREHVPFSLRKTLGTKSQEADVLLKAFGSAPDGNGSEGTKNQACTFVCKGSMFGQLTEADWITANPVQVPYSPGGPEQREKAQNYLYQQCEYSLLSAINVGQITSDGVLLTRYFPSPVLKSLLLSRQVCKHVRAIYFAYASRKHSSFFSQEDRAMLNDIHTFGIDIFHVDMEAQTMHQFTKRIGADSGLMVPLQKRDWYLNATVFGVYGSNLVAGSFDKELDYLLKGIKTLKTTGNHASMNPKTPLALVTGGGPGAMEVGNRVAAENEFLSCGLFVDFGSLARKPGANINEQKKNPYVEAYMTYRPMKLVERQSEFNLDFPIFLTGGVGTDFEFALEEVRRKVGTVSMHPMILFGDAAHWGNKITGRFAENLKSGTIKNSEWLSNTNYVVNTGRQALAVYKKFFDGTLAIGNKHPANELGFVVVDEEFVKSAGLE